MAMIRCPPGVLFRGHNFGEWCETTAILHLPRRSVFCASVPRCRLAKWSVAKPGDAIQPIFAA